MNKNKDAIHALSSHPLGGTLEELTVTRAAPVQRVYATGAGQDEATLTHLAENLELCQRRDPWPLMESTWSDTDTDNPQVLAAHAQATLQANSKPLMQLSGWFDANDAGPDGRPLHPLGSMWPGELVDLAVDGFPDLPDGVYRLRIMRMSGDETGKVQVLFDICEDPIS